MISIAHTWLGLLTSSPRSRYVYTVWPGRRRLVLGLRYSASMPIRRISVAMCLRPEESPSWRSRTSHHPTACKRILKVQLIDAAHQSETGFAHRPWPVVDAPAADAHCLCLAGERQLVIAVDHRLAPGNPAFVSAASKKSFSNASSPILA